MLALSTTIVVPVLNGERHLEQLLGALDELDRSRGGTGAEPVLEVVLVDDGSSDASWDAIVDAAALRPWLRGIALDGNHGQHAALLQGAAESRTEAIVTMDDDLAQAPRDVPRIVAALEGGADLVYGTPVDRGPAGLRRAGSFAARCALALGTRRRSALRSSPFRAFRRALLAAAPASPRVGANIDAVLYAARPRVVSVDVRFGDASRAPSRYGVRSLVAATAAVARGGGARRADRPVAVRARVAGGAAPDAGASRVRAGGAARA